MGQNVLSQMLLLLTRLLFLPIQEKEAESEVLLYFL